MSQHSLITQDAELQIFCDRAQNQPFLYLDTEFVRTRTLRPRLGLIQAYDGHQVVLIDPLADMDLEPFWTLLTMESVTKVLHSCSEDLEVFKYAANRQPAPLFDTQIAASMLGEGSSLGYAALVEKLINVKLDKGATRTDWVARPLSEQQLAYAGNDVLYLKPIAEQLIERLKARDIYEYVIEEGALLSVKRSADKIYDEVYQDVKNAWRLNSSELSILKTLAAWRQQQAETQDLALNFVLKEPTMVAIARAKPNSMNGLRKVSGILPQEVRRHGSTILDIVEQSLAVPAGEQPKPLVRLVDFAGYKGMYSAVKTVIAEVAESQDLPVEAIASKRQINQLLSWQWKLSDEQKANSDKPDLLVGWRERLVGDKVLGVLN